MTDEQLAAIERRADAAAIGPINDTVFRAHASDDVPALLSLVRQQRERIERLERLVGDFIDDEPCEYDHHGYCQVHGWLEEGECPYPRARRLLQEVQG